LIEGRIASDLKQNLEAIREYVESRTRERAKVKVVPTVVPTAIVPPPPIVIEEVMQNTSNEIVMEQASIDPRDLKSVQGVEKFNILDDSPLTDSIGSKTSSDTNEIQDSVAIIPQTIAVDSSRNISTTSEVTLSDSVESSKPFSFRRMIKNAIGLDLNAWTDVSQSEDSSKNEGKSSPPETNTSTIVKDNMTVEALYLSNVALTKRVEALEKEISQIRTLLK
jgi:hypothetical protein